MYVNTFSGIPLVRMLDDGRSIELVEPFIFCDSKGKEWVGHIGDKANGTSYPKVLWSISGGPWSTKSRWPAIIHDIYCGRRDEPWQAVHRMFGEALLVAGVKPSRAKFEFNMVWQFGPRWDESGNIIVPEEENFDLYPLDLTGQLE